MYCDRCGAQLQESQNFCPSCGRSFVSAATLPGQPGTGAAPPPAASRLANNVRVLGVIWIVYSIVHLLPSLGVFTFGTVGFPWIHRSIGWHGSLPGPFIALAGGVLGIFAIISIIGIIAGWGLLDHRQWARMLIIVLACLALLNIPFGTALGIYTLWVLLPAESEREYRRMAGTY